MTLPATTLKAAFRTHNLTRPTSHTSLNINITEAKARATHWELTLPHDNFRSANTHSGEDNGVDDLSCMVTYSPFNPGASTPLLCSSIAMRNNLPVASPHNKDPSSAQSCASASAYKPWPYRLPVCLQPKVGTTFHAVYGGGDGAEVKGKGEGVKKVGVLQALLYGVPEPDGSFGKKDEDGKREGLVWRVLYGVKEES